MSASRFFNAVPNASSESERNVVSYFLYYLTVEQGAQEATAPDIARCFSECDLAVPKRLSSYLSEGATARPPRYIRARNGYRLQRHFADEISGKLGPQKAVQQTSAELRSLEGMFTDTATKSYLAEAIDCFEAGASRAAVIMIWILTVDHFTNYVFDKKLTEFNISLAKNPGKISKIGAIEDFQDLKEEKIIEVARSARIITNDVRKVLIEGLGTRNSAAHPSDVKIAPSKAISVIEDLVTNVIKKF